MITGERPAYENIGGLRRPVVNSRSRHLHEYEVQYEDEHFDKEWLLEDQLNEAKRAIRDWNNRSSR